MLEVRLESGTWMRKPCLVCSGSTDKDMVQARVHEDGEKTHWVVCQACLALSSADRVAQLRQHASQLRADAADMDTHADALPSMPSHAEWTAANTEADKEFLRDEAQGTDWGFPAH